MKTIRQHFTVNYSFPIVFTRDVFLTENHLLADMLRETGKQPNRILAVIDSGVFHATLNLLKKMERYADCHKELIEFVSPPLVVRGSEDCKRDPSEVEKILALVDKYHLCRHSFILAVGGGAVLDAAGYAAATAHRGIRLIRMPTTTLAQNDAGVGVKNGINAFGRKNFLGTFSPPYAVINDLEFLKTLPDEVLRAGISEAVKVALIKDREFFDFLYRRRLSLAAFDMDALEQTIIRCAELHSSHIATQGDPFEFGSSRPLDFGHWSAHKLEELSAGKVQHGDAVAIGIALDSIYSHQVGLINELELRKILSTLTEVGFRLHHWTLDWLDIGAALNEFREHLGGELTISLLKGLGEKIDVHEIDTRLMKKCVIMLAEQNRRKESADGSAIQFDDGDRRCGDLLY